MKIFLITNPNCTEHSHGEYREIIVASEDEQSAKKINPNKYSSHFIDKKWFEDKDLLIVEYLGEAVLGTKERVLCSNNIGGIW